MPPRTFWAAALLASLAVPAMATTDASVSLSGFTVKLKDLKPADGVTPTLNWTGTPFSWAYALDQSQQGWYQSGGTWYQSWNSEPGLSNNLFDAGSVDLTSLYGNATLHTETTGTGQDAIALAAHAEQGQSVSAQAGVSQSFTLSAGTQATFSLKIDGSWSVPGSVGTNLPNWGSQASSFTNVAASMFVGNNSAYWSASGASYWWQASDAFDSSVDGQTLQLTVKNNSAADISYYLNIYGYANAMEATAPVPEPGSYAMLGAGLLVLGAMARRRRA